MGFAFIDEMGYVFSEDQIILVIISLFILIAIVVVAIQWRKASVEKSKVDLLEKQTELKKIELVEKDLEAKRVNESMTDLSQEDRERLQQIRLNTSEIISTVSLLNAEVNQRVEQLEAKSELLKIRKITKELDKKEKEIEKSLEE